MPRALRPKTPVRKPKTIDTANASDLPAPEPKSDTANDYIEIRLPKVRFQDSPLSPLWVFLLLIFAFLLGMTTTKIQYLQQGVPSIQGAQANAGQPAAITMNTVKQWAKDIHLDSNKFNQCVDKSTYKNNIDSDVTDAIAASAEATPTFYINGTRIVGAVAFDQFKTAIDAALAGKDTGDKINVNPGHLPKLGKDQAKVAIVEFSDLQCPFCLQFHQNTFPQIKKEYIDTGKVTFYYRHLPLTSLHPMAMSFANASECANAQGKFWEMHDKIFKEQEGQS